MTNDKKESKSATFFKFDSIALIIGFIVDTIALASIVLSLQLPEIRENLPNFISPGFAFGLWVLAVYIYFAYLHAVWEKTQSEKNYSEKFSLFLADDLLFSFRNPPLLFPAIVAFVSLFWVASTESTGVFLGAVIAILVMFGIPLLIGLNSYVSDNRQETKKDSGIPEEFKEKINLEWKFLSSQINEILAKQMWVDSEDLGTIATIWEVPENYMNYVLAHFAVKNSRKTKFGYLYSRENDYPVNYGQKVLINLETLNRDKFYYT